MEIQKFEAYKYGYRGKGFKSNRKEAIREIIDCFTDSNLFGFEVSGIENHIDNEIIYLDLFNEDTKEEACVKLDLSGLGIEFGKRDFDEETEEMTEFEPIVNLDNDNVKTVKNIKKYNI